MSKKPKSKRVKQRVKRGRSTKPKTPAAEVFAGVKAIIGAEHKAAFLEAFTKYGRVDLATKEVGIMYQLPAKWCREDPEFLELYRKARYDAAAILEDAVHRRAHKGVRRGVYNRGQLVGFEREYSDSLAVFLLRAHKPDVYKERTSVALTGEKDSPPIEVSHGLTDATADDIRRKVLGVMLPPPATPNKDS